MANTSREAVQKYWESVGAVTITATDVTTVKHLTPLAESARRYIERFGGRFCKSVVRQSVRGKHKLSGK